MMMMSHCLCPIDLEKSLQRRLSSISSSQLKEGQDIQNLADTADDIKHKQKTYETEVKNVQTLMDEMKRKLEEAKEKLRTAVSHWREALLCSVVMLTAARRFR